MAANLIVKFSLRNGPRGIFLTRISKLAPLLLLFLTFSALPTYFAGSVTLSNSHAEVADQSPPQLSGFAAQPRPFQTNTIFSPVVGSNIQITSDPAGEPQNEPTVAVDPQNSSILVAGANDYRLVAQGFDAWAGFYTSEDAGLSWTNGLLPGYPGGPTSAISGFQTSGDPALAFDKQGAVYYAGIAFNRTPNGGAVDGTVFLFSSKNLGSTSQTVIVASGSTSVFNDKPYVAVDTTNSTFSGRVYVSWTDFTSTRHGTTGVIHFSYSTNGGTTFSSPTTISDTSQNQGSVPAVGPGGVVYVSWLDFTTNRVKIAKSTNGGVSFTAPTVAASIVPLPSTLPPSSFRTNNNPAIAVDPVSGNIYIAWNDYRNGNADIFLTRSTDGGTAFTAPIRLNDDNTSNDQFFPWLASVPGRVSAIFYDRRLDPANHLMDVFYTDSQDGGASFTPNTRVTAISSDPNVQFNGQFIGDYIGLAMTTTDAHSVWTDTRNANQDIFTDRTATVQIHNIAALGVTLPRRTAYNKIASTPLNATITISNKGNIQENVTVQLKITLAASSLLENQTVKIAPAATRQVSFLISPENMVKGNYTVVATALPVPGETDTSDNTQPGGTLQVRIPGDVDGNGRVNILDAAILAFHFDQTCASPNFLATADFDNNCRIDIIDASVLALYFGTVDP